MADKTIKMERDPEAYPAPHSADVHPEEVENFRLGGFVPVAGVEPAEDAAKPRGRPRKQEAE